MNFNYPRALCTFLMLCGLPVSQMFLLDEDLTITPCECDNWSCDIWWDYTERDRNCHNSDGWQYIVCGTGRGMTSITGTNLPWKNTLNCEDCPADRPRTLIEPASNPQYKCVSPSLYTETGLGATYVCEQSSCLIPSMMNDVYYKYIHCGSNRGFESYTIDWYGSFQYTTIVCETCIISGSFGGREYTPRSPKTVYTDLNAQAQTHYFCRFIPASPPPPPPYVPPPPQSCTQQNMYCGNNYDTRYPCHCCEGQYKTSINFCLPCAAGFFKSATEHQASSCETCEIGKYQTESGASFCNLCPIGTSSYGASSCDPCTPGRYVGVTGSVHCLSCDAGKYSTVTGATSSSVCGFCPIGMYSTAGSRTCTSCAAGKYSTAVVGIAESVCSACPSNLYSPEGSDET